MYQALEILSSKPTKDSPKNTQKKLPCVTGDSSASEDLPWCVASIYTNAGGRTSLREPREEFVVGVMADATESGFVSFGEVVLIWEFIS